MARWIVDGDCAYNLDSFDSVTPLTLLEGTPRARPAFRLLRLAGIQGTAVTVKTPSGIRAVCDTLGLPQPGGAADDTEA